MGIQLVEDKANKESKHILKNRYWQQNNIPVLRLPLPIGDYILLNDKVQDVIDRKAVRGTEIKKMDLMGTFKVSVDTKKDMQELFMDVCQEHGRFKDELILAQQNGVKLYILIDDEKITCTDDLFKGIYENPRLKKYNYIKYKQEHYGLYQDIKLKSKPPMSAKTLGKVLHTLGSKYGCEFIFTRKVNAGAKVIELLTKGEENNG